MKLDVSVGRGDWRQQRCDLLAVPVQDRSLDQGPAGEVDRLFSGALLREAERSGFQGRDGETFVFQTRGEGPASHVLLCGCGPAEEPESWYRFAQRLCDVAKSLSAQGVGVLLAPDTRPAAITCVVEGVELAAYSFDRYRSRPQRQLRPAIRIYGVEGTAAEDALRFGCILACAANRARDLVNLPGSDLTPEVLAEEARRMAGPRLRVRIHDAKSIARLGMGGVLGVARGSEAEPRLVEMRYRPRSRPAVRIALVGKGVTFDSGGLSLKRADAMQTQKRDMAGAATVMAALSALPDLELPLEVRAYVPAVENLPGPRALKPGDVIRTRNGTTVEVLNTDAEGRLILADALCWAAESRPDLLIDFATLTAAVRNALGSRYAAVLASDPELARRLITAGRASGENLWELPLVEDYRPDLDSHVADLRNVGMGQAGTIVAALFLREFTAGIPWAHVDFSSTAFGDGWTCHPPGATGFGVRTLLRFLAETA